MQLSKKDFIQKLYDIEESEKIPTGRMVQKVIRNEIIPFDVISFINEHDRNFLRVYDTYNNIYQSRNKNVLYRNLRNPHLSLDKQAVAISSLITKILISYNKMEDEEEKETFAKVMGLEELTYALLGYALYNDNKALIQCSQQVRELISMLYEKD